MIFKQEMGALLGKDNELLHLIEGSADRVDFPSTLILALHTMSPGVVKVLAHTHPPYMNIMSSRDTTTLKTLAKTLHPFPISLSVIAEKLTTEEKLARVEYTIFSLTTYYAQLESYESYENRKKETPRIVTIKQLPRDEVIFFPAVPRDGYWDLLIRSSYEITS